MKTRILFMISLATLASNLLAQKWTSYNNVDPSGNGFSSVWSAIDKANIKWFVSANSTIWSYNDTSWTKYVNIQDDYKQTNEFIIDNNDNKWIGTSQRGKDGSVGGLWKFDGSFWTLYNSSNGIKGENVSSLAIDNDSNLWVATYTYKNGYSYYLCKFDGKNWSEISLPNNIGGIRSMVFDNLNNLWLGSSKSTLSYISLWKLDSLWTEYYPHKEADAIIALSIDVHGNKWIGTAHGLYVFNELYQNNKWINYSSFVNSLYISEIKIDKSGNKWCLSNENGVYKFDNTIWVNYKQSKWQWDNLTSIAFDKNNFIWFGSAAGVVKFDETALPIDTTINSVGFDNIENSFIIYPNPVSDYLNVMSVEYDSYTIYSQFGQQLISSHLFDNKKYIPLHQIEKGLYYICFKKDNIIIKRKFIKN